MKISIIIILFLLAANGKNIFAQTHSDIEWIKKTNEVKKGKHYHFSGFANPNQFLLTNSFIFYKKYISSQDISKCTFTPSCSEYALQAIKQQGVIIGAINFFDRFSRCNGLKKPYYETDKEKMVLIDPVRNIRYELLKQK
ncbi:MAG: membrane protein insertion efficiency factor YidD [Bacteroidales bacterium]|nr:membrane protein insertion efficiency factor YidD [Bacteroidales bacterium]